VTGVASLLATMGVVWLEFPQWLGVDVVGDETSVLLLVTSSSNTDDVFTWGMASKEAFLPFFVRREEHACLEFILSSLVLSSGMELLRWLGVGMVGDEASVHILVPSTSDTVSTFTWGMASEKALSSFFFCQESSSPSVVTDHCT